MLTRLSFAAYYAVKVRLVAHGPKAVAAGWAESHPVALRGLILPPR
jgi:hypothetical protein